MKRTHARFILLFAAVLASRAEIVRAGEPDDDASDWTEFQAPPSSPTAPAPTTPEGGYSQPDRVKFDEQLRAKVLDQLCRNAKVNYDYNVDIHGFGGPGGGLSRYLATEPGGRQALVDEERLKVSAGHGISREVGGTDLVPGFSVSGTIDGRSMVIRRLASKQSCAEIAKVADLRDIKTVLPFNAERIAAMQAGELWRIPLTLTWSYGAGVSDALADGAVAAVSFGYSKTGAASLTLYRLSEDKLRFRFRINYATVHSKSFNAARVVPPDQLLFGWHGLLLKFLDKQLATQFSKIIAANLSLGEATTDGRRMILEYTVDPRDPAKAEAVAQAIRGDFRRLVVSANRIALEHITSKEAAKAYEELRGISSGELGEPSYAASDAYFYKTRNFTAGLPIFFWTNVSSLFGNSSVTRESGELGEFRFHPGDKSPTREYLHVPFMGPLSKDNDQRHVEVVTYAPSGKPQGEPIMVYIRNKGLLRLPADSVAENVEELNSILRLTGARRGEDGSRLTIPLKVVPPPTPVVSIDAKHDMTGPKEVSDRSGTVSMTLVFDQKAVRECVSAASGEVLKAFAASVGISDRTMAEWLAANGRMEGRRLVYDQNAARAVFKGEDDDRWLRMLSQQAAGLVVDLAAVRDAKDNDEKAHLLAKAVAGKGESGLSYENVLKVLVQFIDPMDLSGDFSASVKCSSKDCKDVNVHLVLKKNRPEATLLKDAGEAKSRFAEPSILYD